jgi:hypothetical protein
LSLKRDEYKIDNERSGQLFCGSVTFYPWGHSDENGYLGTVLQKRNNEVKDFEYALTTSKELGSLDLNQREMKWQSFKNEPKF